MQQKNRHLILFSYGFIALFATACERAAPPSSSKIEIRIPTQAEFKAASKVKAQSAIDYNLLCFAVNVKGGGLKLKTPACDIGRGLMTGSVEPGDALSIEVQRGDGYEFEIYGLLRNSAAEPCPPVTAKSWNWSTSKIYPVGSSGAVNIQQQDVTLTISISMPDASQNIIATNNLPATCATASTGSKPQGRLALGAQVLAGTSLKAYSRISFKDEARELTGTTLKIRNWKTGSTP